MFKAYLHDMTFQIWKVLFFNLSCECLYYMYISIRLWAINIVDFLFLPTICFNRGRLIWNSNALPKVDFLQISYMLIRILPRLLQRSKECRGHYSTIYHATSQWIIRSLLLTQYEETRAFEVQSYVNYR